MFCDAVFQASGGTARIRVSTRADECINHIKCKNALTMTHQWDAIARYSVNQHMFILNRNNGIRGINLIERK